ncbi:YqaA family protein [Defluviicoccus vanus]|uniref:DedA family protein n=1 Tax=Defluviicoccus vanus TaxID=111831 RepID=A0A7H1N3P0_9PROT|nr:YqaA family protein [Defluviicoccus vanus]QNT70326.1 DedA family protein [Defluviicoccus vanus]
MLRRLYDWVMRAAESPQALKWLAAVSFAESSFFPIPPDAMIVPMVLAQPRRAWLIATVCTIASVVGGFFGYAIGYYLYEGVGRHIVEFYGYQAAFDRFRDEFQHWGMWIILIKGLTPIPYKLVTIASGVAHFDLLVFAFASLVTRSARFFLVAALLRYFGPPIRNFIERYLTWVTTAFVALIVAGFVVVTYL